MCSNEPSDDASLSVEALIGPTTRNRKGQVPAQNPDEQTCSDEQRDKGSRHDLSQNGLDKDELQTPTSVSQQGPQLGQNLRI